MYKMVDREKEVLISYLHGFLKKLLECLLPRS